MQLTIRLTGHLGKVELSQEYSKDWVPSRTYEIKSEAVKSAIILYKSLGDSNDTQDQ